MYKLNFLKQKSLRIICQLTRNFSKEKLSYISNYSEESFLPYTIGKLLDKSEEKYTTKEAVIVRHQNIRKNFIQLKDEVNKLAAGFVEIGLQKGDRIGIWSPSNYQYIVTQFAAAKAGLIVVCLNPFYQHRELEYCINKVGMKAIICEALKSDNFYKILNSALPSLMSSKAGEINDEKLPNLSHVIMISDTEYSGTFRFNDVMETPNTNSFQQLEKLEQSIQFDDPANILFTSGTTGQPKGATLSHHNILNNANIFGKMLGFNTNVAQSGNTIMLNQRLCLPTPLYHTFGNTLGFIASVLHGCCSIIPSDKYNPSAIAETIQAERATIMYGTPTMFIDVLALKNFDDYDFASLQTGVVGGANTSNELLKNMQDKLKIGFKHGYGCTETTAGVFLTNPLTQENSEIIGPMEVKIIDNNDNIIERGKNGELCVRGYNIMLGYWNDSEKTKEVISASRWYKTGDIAEMNEKGYIEITGRIKEMIIKGGTNIFPKEIEDFLDTHPDIVEAQVIGVPDERLGEQLCAWIKLKAGKSLTEDDIKSFCKGQIAHFKIPYYVLFVQDYPKTPTGKVQKWKMQAESEKLLNLNKDLN